MDSFYVDTCIYLDLWQKNKFMQHAQNFITAVSKRIYYSGFVLKELSHQLSKKEYQEKMQNFFTEYFEFVKAENKDYDKARAFELQSGYQISFFDCMHLTLAMRTKSILITRDRKLLEFANKHWKAVRPEELHRINFIKINRFF